MTALIKDPVLSLSYGPSGIGKTTDTGLSFPNALFIAAPGALQSIRNVAGYEPLVENASTLLDVTKLVSKVGEYRAKGADVSIDAVVVDDFSYLAEQTFASLEKKFNGFRLWGELRDAVLDFRNAARFAKVHVVVNCWEQAPKDKPGGGRVKGGPMLSGNLPEQVPAMFDMVLRCGLDPMRKPWPGIYQCMADPNYIMKDRLNVASAAHPAPMNMAELMRAAGYTVSRRKEIAGQEDMVEKVAQAMVANGPAGDKDTANLVYAQLMKDGIKPQHARWTLRDAMDRAVIRRALQARDAVFLT